MYKILVNMKKKIIVLVITTLLILGITFLSWPISTITNPIVKRLLGILLNLSNGAVAFVAIKLTKIDIGIELKNYWQFIFGATIALSVSLFVAFIPAFFGFSIVGNHQNFDWGTLLYSLFFYFLIIGPVEELIFRVYFQETFISFFKKHSWIGVIIAAAMFGIWHLINGSLFQVLFTFGFGLLFGFAKYFLKKFKYLGLSFGHGLYDFLNVIVRMFIV